MNTITQSEIELSERLRKACLEKGISEPRFVAQDLCGEWFHYSIKPYQANDEWLIKPWHDEVEFLFVTKRNPNWRETLMEWNPKAGVPLSEILQNTCEHCGRRI